MGLCPRQEGRVGGYKGLWTPEALPWKGPWTEVTQAGEDREERDGRQDEAREEGKGGKSEGKREEERRKGGKERRKEELGGQKTEVGALTQADQIHRQEVQFINDSLTVNKIQTQ